MNSREKDFLAKQEAGNNDGKISKASSSRPWSGLKDPRIVRVSRSFGGKDRHSKVCTIRGLRDRRVRLSVPTAIQLYDLQDKLGLNQPSKVVDWLLNVAQPDIDKLPPLQMPPEGFVRFHEPLVVSHEMNQLQVSSTSILCANAQNLKNSVAHSLTLLSGKRNLKSNDNAAGEDRTQLPRSMHWSSDTSLRAKCKEVRRESVVQRSDWMKRNEDGNQEGTEVHTPQVSAHSSLSRPNYASLPNLLNNAYYHWELPTNPCGSHLGALGISPQIEETHNNNATTISSSLSLPSGSQVLLCPSRINSSILPSYVSNSTDYDLKQLNHFQMLSSASQNLFSNSTTTPLYSISPSMRPFQVNITPKHQPTHDNHETQ